MSIPAAVTQDHVAPFATALKTSTPPIMAQRAMPALLLRTLRWLCTIESVVLRYASVAGERMLMAR
jgi:hypothetical protein